MIRVILLLVVGFFTFSCSEKAEQSEEHNHAQQVENGEKYTCPMHPNVIQDKPGTCPVCGMELVLVNNQANENQLMLTDSQIKLANITTQQVSLKPIGQTLVLNGRLAENEETAAVVSSRSEGRIEKLFQKENGRAVTKGEPLYELYSETLLTLQREYLLAKEQYEALGKNEMRYLDFLKAAERKLLLYGLSQKQIGQLAKSKELQQKITFLSPASGIITEINVSEGQYVSEGSILYRITNISTLWVEGELYPEELNFVRLGDKINVLVPGEPSGIEAVVNFLSPEYRNGSQITVLRASIQNKEGRLKPGMPVQLLFTHSTKKAIALPVDAVIRDEKGTHVYIETDRNTFEPRMVKTGLEDFNQVEILDGLKEGETVAITGAYLLYSEIVLKKGTDPMAAHNH